MRPVYIIFDIKKNEPWFFYIGRSAEAAKEDFVYASGMIEFTKKTFKGVNYTKKHWAKAKKLGFRVKKMTYENGKVAISKRNY